MNINQTLSNTFQHGLVIGKFYPPHLGHCLLIRNAALASKIVTVVVMASTAELIPLESRVDWLKSTFRDEKNIRVVGVIDDVAIDYEDEKIWLAHIDLMHLGVAIANTNYSAAPPIDAVFSSENYGVKMAKYFNAVSVQVDIDKNLVPTSGTSVRQNLIQQWSFLPQATQSGLCHRVVIVGGESSGKTTLAKALSKALQNRAGVYANTQFVPEFGREYSQLKLRVLQGQAKLNHESTVQNNNLSLDNGHLKIPTLFDCQWWSEEFLHIAKIQTNWENQASKMGSPILIADTDAFATGFWHKRYMGFDNLELNDWIKNLPARSLYILPTISDVAFEQDGLRDGEHIRHQMHQEFQLALQSQKTKWIEVSGSVEHRVKQALIAIDQLRHAFEEST